MSELSLESQLRDAGIISYEPVKLRGDESSDYYVDIKRAYGNPRLLSALARATIKNLDPRTTCIAASGYGGLPLGVSISQQSGLALAMVRDTEKNHGARGFIDGHVPTKADAVEIVDDVFTSGNSLRITAENLRLIGAHVLGCHVVVARGDVSDFSLPVSYLIRPEDIV